MSWIQVLTIVLANIGWCTTMFLWLRKEANADRKELATSINSGLTESRKEMAEFRKMWAEESREFHGRLCQIEERNTRTT